MRFYIFLILLQGCMINSVNALNIRAGSVLENNDESNNHNNKDGKNYHDNDVMAHNNWLYREVDIAEDELKLKEEEEEEADIESYYRDLQIVNGTAVQECIAIQPQKIMDALVAGVTTQISFIIISGPFFFITLLTTPMALPLLVLWNYLVPGK